ncbi:MAG: polysaccharide biosynthesis tyrosine autokinase [Deltaproteobacteria bacterium]|nr:polysaccharide biosynthesis tyrosine autokinase [Deltaproteobacteria bacterium]
MEEVTEKELNIKDYIRIVRKRLWLVAAILIIAVTIAAVKAFSIIPIYQASVKILIERENPNILSFQDVMNIDASSSDYYATQAGIISSRRLARKVFDASPLNKLKKFEGVLYPESVLLNMLTVNPERGSRFVHLSIKGPDPEEAADLANLWADTYVEQNLTEKINASSQATIWLSEQVKELQEKVTSSEFALQEYKEKHNIISLEERQNIVVQKLSELNSALIKANMSRLKREAKYGQLNELMTKNSWEALTNLVDSPQVNTLNASLLDMKRERAELSGTYGKKHPKMASIISQIKTLEAIIAEEVRKFVRKTKDDYEIAKLEEVTLRKSLDEQKREALALNKKAIKYNVLKRESEGNRKLFDVLLNRLKETSLTEGMEFNNIRIVDYAQRPGKPVYPNKRKMILMGVLIGLFGGISLTLFLEFLDDRIKSESDVERYLGIPFLGTIPAIFGKEQENLYLITDKMPKSMISEAFRGLRTSVLFSSSDKEIKTIMVTSGGPGEGKTTAAINLAVTMSHEGKRSLLIDCDLRRPTLQKVFNLKGSGGLSNILVDHDLSINAVINETGIENLGIITCGPIPPNPSELLGSRRMQEIISILEKDYDRIIFDSPPSISLADAAVLGRAVDGVVLVVDTKSTARGKAQKSIKALSEVGANMIGVALNRVNTREDGYYGYYYYNYNYGNEKE